MNSSTPTTFENASTGAQRQIRDDRLARADIAARLVQAMGGRDIPPQLVKNQFNTMLKHVDAFINEGKIV